jgi:hypothetical protein
MAVFKSSNKYRNIQCLRLFCLRIIAELQPKKAIIRAGANAGCGDDLQNDRGIRPTAATRAFTDSTADNGVDLPSKKASQG